nr:hypothetical protein [uncultured Desulfuromonas sp.]
MQKKISAILINQQSSPWNSIKPGLERGVAGKEKLNERQNLTMENKKIKQMAEFFCVTEKNLRATEWNYADK